jgi:putative ABC transport system permease protein
MSSARTPAILLIATMVQYWRRHKIQFFTLFLGLALATALWSAVQAINEHARQSYGASEASVTRLKTASFRRIDGGYFSDKAFAAFRRNGFNVTPVLTVKKTINAQELEFIGIEPLSARDLYETQTASSLSDSDAAFFLSPGILATHPLSEEILKNYLNSLDLSEMPIVRTSEGIEPGSVTGDIGLIQKLTGNISRISELILLSEPIDPNAKIPANWNSQLVRSDPPINIDIAELTESFHLNLTAFGLLCFLVGLFIVYSSISLAFEERRASIRTLRICGVSLNRIISVLIFEVSAIAILAGIFGLILGYLIAGILLPDVATSLRGLYGANIEDTLAFQPLWAIEGLFISVAGAFGASAMNLYKIKQMPLLARKGSGLAQRKGQLGQRYRLMICVILTIAGLALYLFGSGVAASFIIMATILLFGAFILPVFLNALISGVSRTAKNPIASWFWADTQQQMPALSLALTALLLALSANIGVGTMVDGFRDTFVDFLDERLAPEIYINAPDANTAEAINVWLQNRDDIDAILPNLTSQTSALGQPISITGFIDHPTFRDTWTLLSESDDAWNRVIQGDVIFINEQLAIRNALKIGQSLDVSTPNGLQEFEIAGIYADYGNPRGAIRMSLNQQLELWPDLKIRQLGVRTSATRDTIIEELKSAFDLSDNQVIDQARLKAFSLGIFEKTFAVSAALNTLTLGVAGFAIFTGLLTLSNARIESIAPVWAMGLTRHQISALEFGKIIALALMTALAAIPLGVAVAWCLVAVINVEAFGWRLPLYLYPGKWVILTLTGVIAAALAALLPTIRLGRSSPAKLAKVFAHER